MTLYGIWNASASSIHAPLYYEHPSLVPHFPEVCCPGYTKRDLLYTVQSPKGFEDDKLGVQAAAKLPNLHTHLFPDV